MRFVNADPSGKPRELWMDNDRLVAGVAYKAIEGATVFCKLRGNPYVELVHWIHQIVLTPDSGSPITANAPVAADGTVTLKITLAPAVYTITATKLPTCM